MSIYRTGKKFSAWVLSVTLLLMMTSLMCSALAASAITVNVDGENVQFTQPPIVQDGRTLVPMRAIFEALGMEVAWDANTQSVTASKDDGLTIKLQIGSKTATVGTSADGTITTELDVAPQILNSSTLVPVRFVGESSGADVAWDAATSTVSVISSEDRYFSTMKDMTTTDGSSLDYIGYISFSGDDMDGFGQATHPDGRVYVGNWKHGAANGYGRVKKADGSIFTGTFVDGYLDGSGSEYMPDGTVYIGNFVKGFPNGQGTMYISDGTVYTGNFVDGLPNGQGTVSYSNGDRYVGAFVDGKRQGTGTYYSINGHTKTGTWNNDKFMG